MAGVRRGAVARAIKTRMSSTRFFFYGLLMFALIGPLVPSMAIILPVAIAEGTTAGPLSIVMLAIFSYVET